MASEAAIPSHMIAHFRGGPIDGPTPDDPLWEVSALKEYGFKKAMRLL